MDKTIGSFIFVVLLISGVLLIFFGGIGAGRENGFRDGICYPNTAIAAGDDKIMCESPDGGVEVKSYKEDK